MRESLTKLERIRSKTDFKNIFVTSYSVSCKGAKMFYKINDLGHSRFGVTLRRHYGNSVERNYARRVLKEIFRTNKKYLNNTFDVLIVLYPGSYSYRQRQEQFINLLKRADIAKNIE